MSSIYVKPISHIGMAFRVVFITGIVCMLIIAGGSCSYDQLNDDTNNMVMPAYLSAYNIFQGDPSELAPTPGFEWYEISTELFSDYALKQRLIKAPAGATLKANGDELPYFPDGVMLVKTFYYYNDERDFSKGKRLIETRLEIKHNGQWNVATYLWNNDQTDAQLITAGLSKTVNWINQNGEGVVAAYRIPSNRECATCHSVSDLVAPLGTKLRNLNRNVDRDGLVINQLDFLANRQILEPVDRTTFSSLPDWENTSYTIQERARAYLEINCAHCHIREGYAKDSRLLLNYERPFSDTGIGLRKDEIIKQMDNGEMPGLGTTLIHKEGLQVLKEYINSL